MAKKVPMVIYVDPDTETQFTIKPFAAGLAEKVDAVSMPDGTSTSACATNLSGSADVDVDVDFT